jgi:hypothetical protein
LFGLRLCWFVVFGIRAGTFADDFM